MDLEFAKGVMAVPSCTRHEDFLVECIIEWCKQNGIQTRKDGAGNLYLTKGGGRDCVCFVAHLDTVQDKQAEYADNGKLLDVKVDGDKMYVDGMGIGADDRTGICVALACMKNLRKCKAAFFSAEEIGCKGSERLDVDFFKDVSYCIGLDSPEFNRSAKTSMGVKLFGDDLWKLAEPIFRKNGVTNFRDEPGCDAMMICIKTKTACFNTGSGGYFPHTDREYAKFSEMNSCEDLCMDLVKNIPTDKKYEVDGKMPPPPPPRYYPGGFGQYAPFRGPLGGPRQEEFRFDIPKPRKATAQDAEFWMSDDELSRKYKLPLTANVSIVFGFTNTDKFSKFVNGKVLDLPVDIQEEEEDMSVTITGQLKDVRQAWVIAFNAEESTNYSDFGEFTKRENADDFWEDLVPTDRHEPDDVDVDDDFTDDTPPSDPGDDIDDFWSRMKNR